MSTASAEPAGFLRLRWMERQLWRLARRDVPLRTVRAVLADPGGSPEAWRATIELGARLSVLPLVARAVTVHASLMAVVPDDGTTALRLAEWSARARHASYVRALSPVLARWAAAGIRPVFLKGIAVAHTLYPSGTRWLHDADIWVPPAAFVTAEQMLHEAGFVRLRRPGLTADEARRAFHGQVYVRTQDDGRAPLVIDLHDALVVPGSRFTLDPATASTDTIQLADGHVVDVLRREEQFVHLAMQIAADGRMPLQRLADLVALRSANVEGMAPLDDARLASIAAHVGAAQATALAVEWAAHADGEHVDRLHRRHTAAASAAGAVVRHPLGWLPDRELPAPLQHLVALSAVRPGLPRAAALLEHARAPWRGRRGPWDRRAVYRTLRLPLLLLAGLVLLGVVRTLGVIDTRAQERLIARCWRRRGTTPDTSHERRRVIGAE